jgi:hypothetical protein
MSALCQCGCGKPAPIARQTDRKMGYIRGEPLRFRQGHGRRGWLGHNRLSPVDYVIDDNGCWIWQLHTSRGYGRTKMGGRTQNAHRAYYELAVEPIPAGWHLDHLCRVTLCVNPDHMEPVTPRENQRRSRNTKITWAIASEIRASKGRGVDVADQFGVSPQLVCDIRKGRNWVLP